MSICPECNNEFGSERSKSAIYCSEKCRKKVEQRRYMKKYKNKYHEMYTLYHKLAITALGGKCSVCGSTSSLEIDHKIPSWNGGKNEIENLQILCLKCHREKTREEFQNNKWSVGWSSRQ